LPRARKEGKESTLPRRTPRAVSEKEGKGEGGKGIIYEPGSFCVNCNSPSRRKKGRRTASQKRKRSLGPELGEGRDAPQLAFRDLRKGKEGMEKRSIIEMHARILSVLARPLRKGERKKEE